MSLPIPLPVDKVLIMTKENSKKNTKDAYIQLPASLAERVKAFASKNNYTVEGVVIEALKYVEKHY